MPAQKGRELVLQIDDGAGGFETVGGFKSNNFKINGTQIDITNKDSAGFKEALSGGVNVSVEAGGGGVFMDDDAFRQVHDAALSFEHLNARIIIPDFMHYTGPFTVTELTLEGGTQDAVTYNISLSSAGAITATPV